ncbi:MAG: efflux RND transporter permease subunit [Acidobacteria bacterium]|nr:efflux RND transporter permease subunit [Acidobacteriota bacterium]
MLRVRARTMLLDALIRWSLHNRLTVLAVAAAFLVWGSYVAVRMPVDVLPDLTAPTVTVLVEARGMAPTDMEALVTFPIEAALNGASGVRRVRSSTAVGIAVIWVDFDWGADVLRARQTVSERLAAVAGTLPDDVAPPVMAPLSSIMGEIMFVALQSSVHAPLELRTTAETLVRRRVLATPGVAQVTVIGGERRQFEVLVDPERLADYGVALSAVEDAMRLASRNTSAGFRRTGGQEYLIQGAGRAHDVEGIGATVITTREMRPIRVRDVADVRIGESLKRGEGSRNGRPAVILGIHRQPDVNTLALTADLDRALDEIQSELPVGMELDSRLFRQADFIELALANLNGALRDGTLLVVLVTLLFLANLRAGAITLLAIPLSLLAAVVGVRVAGLSINSMTLGGMAIAVGALVDDAIVDVENVVRRLRENAALPEAARRPVLEVVYRASREIRASIVYATLIVMLVFLPLFFLVGVEGRLLQPLGLAYLIALGASLVVALTVTPALCSYLLPGARRIREGREPALAAAMRRGYGRLLPGVLRQPELVLAAAGLLFAVSLATVPRMGRAFLPAFNEGALVISAVTLPGTSLEESDALGSAIERLLLDVPEVAATGRRTGRAELDEHVQGVESAEIDVRLTPGGRPRDIVLEEIRERLSLVPGTNITIGQPISHRIDHMLSGARANIAVKIFGSNLNMLRGLGAQSLAAMQGVPGLVDVALEPQADIPTVRVGFNRAALARHGLPAGQAASMLETALLGRRVGQIIDGQLAVPLVLRYATNDLADLEAMWQTRLDMPAGARVPLGSLADIVEDRGPNFIGRENAQRRIIVTANVAGRDLGSVVADVRERVAAGVTLPEGYRVEYGGQFEAEEEAERLLLGLGVGAVAGIFLILYSAFRSTRDAAIIMLNLPLALIGGVAGVFLGGGVLSIAALIGFIALFGIATRNGIMLVSRIRRLREEERDLGLREAVIRGSVDRLVPIVMTALSTGLALLPVALRFGVPGSEIQAPLALVIVCGLFSSTALNMFVVPAVVLRSGARASRLAQ